MTHIQRIMDLEAEAGRLETALIDIAPFASGRVVRSGRDPSVVISEALCGGREHEAIKHCVRTDVTHWVCGRCDLSLDWVAPGDKAALVVLLAGRGLGDIN